MTYSIKGDKIQDLKDEVWKEIPNTDGFYQVSSMGRVKSMERVIPHNKSGTAKIKEKLLKLTPGKMGYLSVRVYCKDYQRSFRVHRLVAQAFIPNPEGLPEVNHMFGDKQDNRAGFLEWATCKGNIRHGMEVLGHTHGAITHSVELIKSPLLVCQKVAAQYAGHAEAYFSKQIASGRTEFKAFKIVKLSEASLSLREEPQERVWKELREQQYEEDMDMDQFLDYLERNYNISKK